MRRGDLIADLLVARMPTVGRPWALDSPRLCGRGMILQSGVDARRRR
jgi:hypothetical protein